VDPSSFVEKSDMARKVAELAAAGPVTAGAAGQQGGGGTHPAPPGFVFHPHSGYFYNSEVCARAQAGATPLGLASAAQAYQLMPDSEARATLPVPCCAAWHVL
jgi:hypothetical protein